MQTFCFDIDGTICSQEINYEDALPLRDRINRINELYDKGHCIKFFTARGSLSGEDWRRRTEAQLSRWGVRYHELLLGKPHADVYVDDKACHPADFDWSDSR